MNGQFQNQALLETQSPDRFQFGIFVAILFHAILVFGIGFSWQKQLHRNEVLEFTLVQSADSTSEMIESPDIMAQRSQLGGGEDTASKQATIDELPIDSQQPFQIPEAGVDESSELQSESGAETLISERESDRALNRQVDQLSELTRQRLLDLQAEQAEQRALLANRRDELLAKKRELILSDPKLHAAGSASAQYMIDLQKRIESVGTSHFPQAALQRNIFGNLSLVITILPDGSIEEIEILRSSGYPVLDQAALEIAQLAAPFDPFPPELLSEYDRIHYPRLWRFSSAGDLATDVTGLND